MVSDITGRRFGRLVALGRVVKNGVSHWKCQCDCGNATVVRLCHLSNKPNRKGVTRSCGRLKIINTREANMTYGLTRTVEYQTWSRVIGRCYNERNPKYPIYGGRGIMVHIAWVMSFEAFLMDMRPRPGPGYSIERIDNNGHYEPNNGHYEPNNCKWATPEEQALNRRLRQDNSSGYTGVYLRGGRYRAEIRRRGKMIRIGAFDAAEEAANAVKIAAEEWKMENQP